jgi:hypothetical protein
MHDFLCFKIKRRKNFQQFCAYKGQIFIYMSPGRKKKRSGERKGKKSGYIEGQADRDG